MSTEDLIKEYGVKGANLMHIHSELPDIPVARFHVKKPSESIDSVLGHFKTMKKPVIVRSSPYVDYDGVYDSFSDVYDAAQLKEMVCKVENSSLDPRARKHADLRGDELSDKIPVIIQEQVQAKYNGCMLMMPNNPDWLYVSQFDTGSRRFNRENISIMHDFATGKKADFVRTLQSHGISDEKGRFFAEHYKALQSLWPGYSILVEYGDEPFSVFEVKLFKQIRTADFELPEVEIDFKHADLTDFVIGLTPPEGIALPVVRGIGYKTTQEIPRPVINELNLFGVDRDLYLPLFEIQELGMYSQESESYWEKTLTERNLALDEAVGEPYAYFTTSIKDHIDLDLTVPNISALITGDSDHFLTHNMIRVLRRAEISCCLPYVGPSYELFTSMTSLESRVRIISNGRQAIVMKE